MSGLHSGFVGFEVTEEAGVGIADISTSGKEVPDGTGGLPQQQFCCDPASLHWIWQSSTKTFTNPLSPNGFCELLLSSSPNNPM